MKNSFPYYEPRRDIEQDLNCNYRNLFKIKPHFHQAIEITCILSGELYFSVGGKTEHLCSGDISFTPPYSVHHSTAEKPADAVVIIIPKRYFDEFANSSRGASYSFLTDKEKNKDIIEVVKAVANRKKPMPSVLEHAFANMVLGLILDRYVPENKKDSHQDLIEQIIAYIDEHFREDISLQKISEHFGYSKYYFSRIFNKTFNCNLNAYVNSLRARAVEKNSNGDSKTKIITDSGFNSLSSYYRCRK